MTRDTSLDIAVTGMAARFPGATGLDDWWSALVSGQVLTTRYARDELLAAGLPPDLVDDPDYVPVRGHLAGAEHFENTLFHVSPREAELTDPQHRLMLEVAWAALEDSGVAPRDVPLRTGVFASATGSAYLRAVVAHRRLDPGTLDDLVHGTEPDFMASRIAYKLGLTGPAMAIQTACSSSLVAVHTAVRSLRDGDCDQALVVASGFDFPQAGYLHLAGSVQSASGDCRPFDENADGVVGGSGVACVVLRRLSGALEDGADPYGVILGTAVNNDGSAKVGYYAPSGDGQQAVIRAALHTAGVDAGSIGYLEAHGTGTRIGDPIEWSAASAALRDMGARPGQVAVGALKANIGHLDAAAGLAGLIKALLVLKEGVIPPVAGFARANPLLDVEDSPLHIPTRATFWTGPQPRRAGVSAFGIGGTNAHVVIEQAPVQPAAAAAPPRCRLVVLSAADSGALARSANRLADHLAAYQPDISDVSRTLATGRAALPERLAVTGRSSAEIADRLRTGSGVVTGRRPVSGGGPLVLLFPGQGSQHPGMALAYQEALPAFSDALDRCLDAFERPLATRVRLALHEVDFPAGELDETELAQPALFAVGWAAATALAALGLHPAAVAGHSLGEITAACVAGVFDLAAAASFVEARGRAMRDCPPGAMLALGCGVAWALRLVAESGLDLDVASVNGTDTCVVAGPDDAIRDLRTRVGDQIFARQLRTTRAFHSRLIEPAIPRLTAALERVTLHAPTVPIVSGLDGRIMPANQAVPGVMFVDQARQPVRLDAVMSTIVGSTPHVSAVDIGPGRAMASTAEAAGLGTVALTSSRSPGADTVLAAVGALWAAGQPVSLAELGEAGRRIHLPGYPFAGPRWIAEEIAHTRPAAGAPARPVAETAAKEPVPDPPAVLATAWAELLGHDDLTDDSDFFQLGGDSLLITRLARRVNTELGIKVPIRDMLASRTLGRQAVLVLELVRNSRSG
jgi:acyl transferase domain-containing protein